MRQTVFIVTALLGMLTLAPVWLCQAQNTNAQATGGTKSGQALSPEQFVHKASAMNLGEINLGILAEKAGATAGVRNYGKMLVKHHTENNQKLLKIANSNPAWKAASSMDSEHQELWQQLMKLKGPAFDQAFVHHMLKDHVKGVALFEIEAKNARNAELRMYARETLSVLHEHLKMAQKLAGKEKGGSGQGQ